MTSDGAARDHAVPEEDGPGERGPDASTARGDADDRAADARVARRLPPPSTPRTPARVIVPGEAIAPGVPDSANEARAGSQDENPALAKGIDRLLSVQRPLVLAHIRSIRARRPDASPEEIVRVLERRYLTAVTSGGALVGASAAIPAVGVGTSLALSGVETAGFLEASALFAQSVTEVHGIAVVDPDRARTLVMAMILGSGGADLVKQFATQAAGGGAARSAYWGQFITSSMPNAVVGQIADRMRSAFVRRFAASQGASIVGRTIPFGIGAAIGGTGNHLLGRRVVNASRTAFGPAPTAFPAELELLEKQPREKKPREKKPREKRPTRGQRSRDPERRDPEASRPSITKALARRRSADEPPQHSG